jgi:hypothetical protein
MFTGRTDSEPGSRRSGLIVLERRKTGRLAHTSVRPCFDGSEDEQSGGSRGDASDQTNFSEGHDCHRFNGTIRSSALPLLSAGAEASQTGVKASTQLPQDF